jgi:uncharacterized membrane protein YidH (DUF202 family)
VDPEFQRALTIVLIAGGSIMAVATLVLFFAFRAFGGMKTGRKLHLILIAALVVFVFACCLALLVVSYAGD